MRANGTIHRDFDGMDLADTAAAREHAVAQELMQHASGATRHWFICVEDEHGEHQLDLFFADIDPMLGSYPPQMRSVVMETCRRLGALTDIRYAVRATVIETRVLIARSRRKPHLAYARDA